MIARAGLRSFGIDVAELATFAVAVVLVGQLVVLGASHVLGGLPEVGSAAGDGVAGLGAVVAVGAYVAVVRVFERRAVPEAARGGRMRALGAGVVLGALLFAVVMAVLVVGGEARVTGGGSAGAAAGWLGAAVAAAVLEEVLFRGMLLRLLARSVGTPAALVVCAVLFALAHGGNPGADAAAVAGIVASGLLLGAAYVLTRALWFPVGIHLAWNFTESGIFGADVSGHGGVGLLATQLGGSHWMTGGAFGPEAGLPTIAILVATSAVLLARARTRGAARPKAGAVRQEP